MNAKTNLALMEINEIAMQLLLKKLGTVNTIRFINQFTLGVGDSVAEKELLFGQMKVEEIISMIKNEKSLP